MTLAVISPTIIGVMSRPELVTLTPSTPWKIRGTKMIVPNIPKAVRNPTSMEIAKVEFLNRCRGTIGSLARVSSQMKAASMTTASTSRLTTCQESQAWSRVMESAISSGTSPAERKKEPTKSMSRQEAWERTKGSVTITTATATRPTGTLTSKTQRQLRLSVM